MTDAFDPEAFRRAGHDVVDLLADYLASARRADGLPVLGERDPEALYAATPGDFPDAPAVGLRDQLAELIARSNHLHHPGYVGHQVASVLPQAALIDAVGALLNNGVAIFEMGPIQTVMERRVVEFLAKTFGFDDGAGGVMTHGGSLGNLTALLAARQAKSRHDAWADGQGEPFAVLVSEQAHYCIARALQVMGQGREGAILVPTDERFRMRTAGLAAGLDRARDAGRRVLAVVASSCTTATGTFDPLEEIADFCAVHDLWLHVDGAHGAALALSATHRHKLRGIERADSVVCDLHKMMMLPALVTAVVFRERARSHEAFAQEASYLFSGRDQDADWFDLGRRTLECTKRAMGATAYVALRAFGVGMFREHVDSLIGLATDFAERVDADPAFELATRPEANIVCFRPVGATDGAVRTLRERVVASGAFYVVVTELRGRTWLRITLMNPRTEATDLGALLDALRG